jgi:hypothetical protein
MWMAVRQRVGEAERRDQLTLIAEEAREAAERGLQYEFLDTLCELAWELATMTRFRLPGGRVTGWTRRFKLPKNAEFSGSLSDLQISFYSYFSAHTRKSECHSFDLVEQLQVELLPRYDIF